LRRPASAEVGLALELMAMLEALARHRLLDRLIRGRTWIGLVAFALIGIVTLQLALLKLNGGIGRALEHEARLQRENAQLSIENSELAESAHVGSAALRLGMRTVAPSGVSFLSARPTDLPAALAALSASSELRPASGGEQPASAASGSEAQPVASESSTAPAAATGAGAAGASSEAAPESSGPHEAPASTEASASAGQEAVAPAGEPSGQPAGAQAGGAAATSSSEGSSQTGPSG
jgi:cell division protein FtsL